MGGCIKPMDVEGANCEVFISTQLDGIHLGLWPYPVTVLSPPGLSLLPSTFLPALTTARALAWAALSWCLRPAATLAVGLTGASGWSRPLTDCSRPGSESIHPT